jgi:ketosteroid isomerase-like protein
MSGKLDTVNGLFAAIAAKDIEKALSYFADDAVVESPMGPQRGKDQIRGGLKMIVSMPAGGAPALHEEADKVIGVGNSPMGKMTMTFEFNGDLIAKQSVRMG